MSKVAARKQKNHRYLMQQEAESIIMNIKIRDCDSSYSIQDHDANIFDDNDNDKIDEEKLEKSFLHAEMITEGKI